MIPRHSSWMPPRNVMMHASDGQPCTGSPKSIARTRMTSMASSAAMHSTMPVSEANDKGAVEKATMPSSA
mgnify:CR=1 FL=1